MIIHDVEQRSPEWHRLHLCMPTASQFSKIITAVNGDYSASARKYALQLIGRLTSDPEGWQGNRFTDMGEEREPEALNYLRFETGLDWQTVGFIECPALGAGASPDAVVMGNSGLMAGCEIKCKTFSEHVAIVEAGEVPPEHKQQIHGSMAITGLDSWSFLAYHPDCSQQFYTVVQRDDYTAKLVDGLAMFKEVLQELKSKYLIGENS
jgi:hypothetical protein